MTVLGVLGLAFCLSPTLQRKIGNRGPASDLPDPGCPSDPGRTVFLLLSTERDALQARVDLIQQAKTEIILSTFIFESDETAAETIELLREAAQRTPPVKVSVIIDAMLNKISPPLLKLLTNAGVEVRTYDDLNLKHLFHLARRMHGKFMVVDGEHLVFGGRNVEDGYFGVSPTHNLLDRDVYIHSEKMAGEVKAYYEDLKNFKWVNPMKQESFTDEDFSIAEERLKYAHDRLGNGHPLVKIQTNTNWAFCQPDAGPIEFVHLPIQRKRSTAVLDRVIELIDGAQISLTIENAYVIPPQKLKESLLRALARGVKIRIFTNSMSSNDSNLPQAAYLSERRWLVDSGIELYEFTTPHVTMHSKSFAIDRKTVAVGSFNFDPLSSRLNTEVLAVVKDNPRVGAELDDAINDRIASLGARIGSDLKPVGSDDRFPDTTAEKRFKTQLFRDTVMPLFRGHL